MAGNLQAALLERAKREQAKRKKTIGQTIKENLLGDDDPNTMNFGEKVGSLLNMGGEALTLGLVGDEAAAKADEMIGRGSYDERLAQYRGQEEQMRAEHPLISLGAEVAPAMLLPAVGIAQKGSMLGKAAKGFTGGVLSGSTYGFMEGEGDLANRVKRSRDVGLLSGLMGGAAPYAAKFANKAYNRLVSPGMVADAKGAAKLAAAQRLADEGIPTTAGQKTGNRALQFTEEQVGRTSGIMAQQGEDFTRAAMRRIGIDGLATPDNLKKATSEIGSVFEDIAAGADIKVTTGQMKAADDIVATYAESVGSVAALPANIVKKLKSGTITGAEYNDFSSRLGKATKSNDAALREAAIELRSVLDDALSQSVPESAAKRLAEARVQYRDLLAIERAASGAGEETARGVLSPARLRSAIAAQGRRQYTQGGRDLGELSRDAVTAMSRLPSSGTAERMGAMMARALGPAAGGGGLGGIIGGVVGGAPGAAIGASAGILAPALRNAFVSSKPGQAYMANQVAKGFPGILSEDVMRRLAPRAAEAYMAR